MANKNVYVNGRFVGYGTIDGDKIAIWGIRMPTATEIADELERRQKERILEGHKKFAELVEIKDAIRRYKNNNL